MIPILAILSAAAAEPDWSAIARDYPRWTMAADAKVSPLVSVLCRLPVRGLDLPYHSDRVVVYVNEPGQAAFAQVDGERVFPEGSVVVKVKRDGAKVVGLGVMVKRESGYAPERGDWQYALVNGDEVQQDQSDMAHCAACHQGGRVEAEELAGVRLGTPRDAVFLSGPVR